ncbi:hypothetical protein [Hymenobacter weizhouensis]|uniref:hypothetical protein n=1 Tax=Hymenobacter sp. YIM 151500-1 TaxID=2987689 RepID=UPI0022262B43|nr:hypothetical protein [Hymenobacter sp. YIM 151500-1]UYZ64237.1 hypothetical protein OIS53_05160 [Hymenobacter sp. YIM 151500-1]
MKILHAPALLLLSGTLLLAAGPARAQRVLLRATPATDSMEVRRGPNRAVFRHFYLGYAPVAGAASGPGADLRYGVSADFFVGLRHKFRLSPALAVGVDARYAWLTYRLRQNGRKVLPTPARHHTESLTLPQVQLEPYVRLNVGRRGNVVGRYLDLAGWAGWVTGTAHRYEDRPGPAGAARTQVVNRGLPYLNRWPYGVGTRLGSGRYAAVARYRLSPAFSAEARSRYPELPRWTVGLELGWL